ncbi:ABC transporter permease [Micromonospora sp. WMMD558]|uniref:ABC transporter permease n=1 Tax=unclassified Micromonospora TaxID=2617518 RepID=UPI0012B4CFD1|nr:ABC transporter permease [Micromonospora sp. WMMC415]QGN48818.1 ABC transporter permease [Micromonospora sp. WMMC415]
MAGRVVRRLRVLAAHAGLLAGLGLVAAVLLTATPRLVNHYADRALRADVAAEPYLVRDLSIVTTTLPDSSFAAAAGERDLNRYAAALPQPLPRLVGPSWYFAAFNPDRLIATGDSPPMNGGAPKQIGLYAQTGLQEAAVLRAGRWPASTRGQAQVAVSEPVAELLALRPGTPIRFTGSRGGTPAQAVVSGVFAARDGSDPAWEGLKLALDPVAPQNDGDPYLAVAVTDWAGIDAVARQNTTEVSYGWRYRIDERRLDASDLPAVISAVGQARRTEFERSSAVATSLDVVLTRFTEQLRSARGLLAVVQAGLVASLLGLIVLAARLAVQRRHDELALLRARGAALAGIGGWTLAEAVLVQPVAVLAGVLVGAQVPGRADGVTWPLLLLLALLTAGVVPVLAMAGHRRIGVVAARKDLTRARPSARRLTVEATVLLVAVAGVLLLRRRGLIAADGVDAYLSSVPVLVAVAAALVALRVLPWPLRLVDRVAARARGALLFLGAARAGRGAPVTLGPLAVLIVAVSTGVFGAVVATTVDEARDRASTLTVPGDAWLTGYAFAPDSAERLARVSGVEEVARVWAESNRRVLSDAGPRARLLGQARVLVVDAPAFARVAQRSGVDVDVPAALRAAARGDGPVPAVVSPQVAKLLAGGGAADVQNRLYEFSVAAVAEQFPGVGLGSERFVVLPWQALPEYAATPIVPNRYLIAGTDIDVSRLVQVADDEQRSWQAAVLGAEVNRPELPARLQTWEAYREGLDRTGANEVLTLAFAAGAAGGTALALLAVGFAVVADAAGRGRVLSRLRTMGLSGAQGRRLLVYELVPLVVVAAVAGATVGVALPRLLGDSLGLSAFTPGVAVRDHLDPLVVGGVLALVAVGLLAGLAVENLANRRMRLGEVLRVGEENS